MIWSDERLAGDAIAPPLLAAWGQLWTNRLEPYATQREDGTYRWVYEPGDAPVLSAHLRGEATVALSSLAADGSCKWLCLDCDEADALPQLLELAGALAEWGCPAWSRRAAAADTSGSYSTRPSPPRSPAGWSCTSSTTCAPPAWRCPPSSSTRIR